MGGTVFRGPTISRIDLLCKRFAHCETCSGNVICGAGNGYPFTFTRGEEYSTSECDAESNNVCQQARCECSMSTVKNLIEAVFEQGEQITSESCPSEENHGDGGSSDTEISDSADAPYSSSSSESEPIEEVEEEEISDESASAGSPANSSGDSGTNSNNGNADQPRVAKQCCGEGSRWMVYKPDTFECEVNDGFPSLIHRQSNRVHDFLL